MRICFFTVVFLFLFVFTVFSQKGTTVVGIQIKPIFPVDFLGTGKIINDSAGVHFETLLSSGFNAGMVVRHNFTELIAIETGINYVKRKYTIKITDGDFFSETYFRSLSYEIPVLLMIYAQLGEKIYMNASMGPTLDLFPSSIQTYDYYYNHVAYRNHVAIPAITANVGWEYRTEKSGFIYLGASFQRPFQKIYTDKILYDHNSKEVVVQNDLIGSYLTLDIRYYFPQTNPKKEK